MPNINWTSFIAGAVVALVVHTFILKRRVSA